MINWSHPFRRKQMFDDFPKKEIELPLEYKKIYDQHYKDNRSGNTRASSLAQKMESWLHRQVAKDINRGGTGIKTLEIGAGTLNQLPYEKESEVYDIIEPFKSLFSDSSYLNRVDEIYNDISEIGTDRKYDRITSVAVLEHILNLPELVARSVFLLEENARFRAAIPNEGTFLWKLGWQMTTGAEFKRKYGLDYEVLMRHEHVSTAKEIEEVLRHFFKKVRRKVFGINRVFAFYCFLDCSEPDLNAAELYLKKLKGNKIK